MKRIPTPKAETEEILSILIGVWRRFRKESGPPDKLQTREFRSVVSAVKTLVQGLEQGDDLVGQNYFNDPFLLSGYLLYQWVIHYQQGFSLISELPSSPKRVLDLCSGPAPFAFAALRHGASEVFALDQNERALQLGAEICGRHGFPITMRQWHYRQKKLNLQIDGTFDLIVLGHALNELVPLSSSKGKEEQQHLITRLLERLSPEGFLLIVDSSQGDANRRLLELRDHFVAQGVPVQAPCVWRGSCPALNSKGSFCYAQREMEKPTLIKEIQRAASINLGSLKMTYLLFRHPQAQWPSLPEGELYRVISPPVETFQGERYYLCGTNGKKSLGTHLKQHPPESRAFEYLRRGDLLSVSEALEKNHGLDIIEGTHVNLIAPAGKPLPKKGNNH